jgi:hypothetical protein
MRGSVQWVIAATSIAPVIVLGSLTALSAPARVVTVTDDDLVGVTETAAPNSDFKMENGPFFTDFGTLGRNGCEECHVRRLGWGVAADAASALPPTAPFFVFDGSDCLPPGVPNTSASNSTEARTFGNTRIELAIPQGADFSLQSFVDPLACPTAPSDSLLRMYRRPLPVANSRFLVNVMWDGREDVTSTLFDNMKHQADTATLIHSQATAHLSDANQSSIASFQTNLFAAQSKVGSLRLDTKGANGGAVFLMTKVAPSFFIGMNDPFSSGFTSAVFNIYQAWEPGRTPPTPQAAAIGRGEAIFNTKRITIADVPGLNGPDDPLTAPISGFCGTCHNTPNVGSHSSSLFVDTRVTSPAVSHLPVYTFVQMSSQRLMSVTDPGFALTTGRFQDIGKIKVPGLRNLAPRAPYFHNGSAFDLLAVVTFYDQRFGIGLTAQEKSDLVAFLQAL